jgi:hypothetical protein
MNRWPVLAFAAVFLLRSLPLLGAQDDARAILVDAERRQRSLSQEHTAEMVVTSKDGKERRRVCRSYRLGFGADVKALIRFLAPPEVRGIGLLSLATPGQPPGRWMYLPSMKRERRIAAQDQGAAFVGTDFSYEDLQEFDQSRYDVSLLGDESVDGHACYSIGLIPRERSSYARRVILLRKDTLSLQRTEFWREGESQVSKRLDMLDFEQVAGRWIARTMVMTDLQRGSRTTVHLSDIVIDRPQPPDRYTIQNLLREGGDDSNNSRSEARPTAPSHSAAPSLANRARTHPMTSSESDNRSIGAFGFGSTGYAEAKTMAFTGTANSRDPAATMWGTFFIRKQGHIGRASVVGSARAEAISSVEDGSIAFDPADRRVRRSPLGVRELFLTVPVARAVDVQVGRYEVSWSHTDGYSPGDAFLPRDVSDPFSDERLPLWGARLQAERGPLRLDLYSSFITTPWRLPSMVGRYSPFSAVKVFLDDATADPPRRGFQMARLEGRSPHWDAGAWVRTGTRPAPVLTSDVQIDAPPASDLFVAVRREFSREDGVGIDLSRDCGAWMLRGELAALRSRDTRVGDALLWSAEAERPVRAGTVFLTVVGNALESPAQPLLVYDRAYLPGFIAGTTQTEPWGGWRVSWVATVRKIGGILKTELTRDLGQSVKLTVGTDLPYGARLETPGAFWKARQVRATVRWDW